MTLATCLKLSISNASCIWRRFEYSGRTGSWICRRFLYFLQIFAHTSIIHRLHLTGTKISPEISQFLLTFSSPDPKRCDLTLSSPMTWIQQDIWTLTSPLIGWLTYHPSPTPILLPLPSFLPPPLHICMPMKGACLSLWAGVIQAWERAGCSHLGGGSDLTKPASLMTI